MPTPSVLEILKPAIGPSSSHTLGPLLAAQDFAHLIADAGLTSGRIHVTLMGSLAWTGAGHLTDAAVTAGLAGFGVQQLRVRPLRDVALRLSQEGTVRIGAGSFEFLPARDILFDRNAEVLHPNSLEFVVFGVRGGRQLAASYQSVGGGRLVGGSFAPAGPVNDAEPQLSMSAVIQACERRGETLVDHVLRTEATEHGHDLEEVMSRVGEVWEMMHDSIEAGLGHRGILPGGLRIERRAAALYARLQEDPTGSRLFSPEASLASIYAIAVAEENADGGAVVTAPTCGSSGVLPACLRLLQERRAFPDERIHEALLVAGMIGVAAVSRASVAGALVGCQGEIGVASAMAAAASCYLLGGGVREQVDRAAETALEHYLGLTCDPVGGLVQIPCIERNAAGAVSALNAASLAMLSGGRDRVSLDATLHAMRKTGMDMPSQYRETALGGLAAIEDLDGDGLPDAR